MKVTNLEARRRIYNILHDDYFSWTPYSVEALQMAMDALKDFPTQMSGTSEEPKQPDSGSTACINAQNMHVGTTNDLISRQEVIDLLKQLRKDGMMIPWEGKDVFKAIRALPSSKQEAPWIPCSERLPEEETDVLVCNADRKINISRGSYSTEIQNDWIWYTAGWRFGKVVAWMPFPEPYKEGKE